MSKDDQNSKSAALFQQAYEYQMNGDLEQAIETYKLSIETYPLAQAHTYLGWTYSFQGRYAEAIEECKKAIDIDPDYGNPYNDIGAYLIEMENYDEAVPWLEKAITATNYEPRHFPYYNLGRVYIERGMIKAAIEQFNKSLEVAPDYAPSIKAIDKLKSALN